VDDTKLPVLEYQSPPVPSKSLLAHFLEWIVWVIVIFASGILACFAVIVLHAGYYFGLLPLLGAIAMFLFWVSIAFNIPCRRKQSDSDVVANRPLP